MFNIVVRRLRFCRKGPDAFDKCAYSIILQLVRVVHDAFTNETREKHIFYNAQDSDKPSKKRCEKKTSGWVFRMRAYIYIWMVLKLSALYRASPQQSLRSLTKPWHDGWAQKNHFNSSERKRAVSPRPRASGVAVRGKNEVLLLCSVSLYLHTQGSVKSWFS